MNAALRETLVPALRSRGFKGSLPHFRRIEDSRIDLLAIQFDRLGGRFVIEISRCPPDGVRMHWGEHVPPARVTARDLHPDARHRLGSPAPGEEGRWFRFDDGTSPARVAEAATAMLEEADRWWDAD